MEAFWYYYHLLKNFTSDGGILVFQTAIKSLFYPVYKKKCLSYV